MRLIGSFLEYPLAIIIKQFVETQIQYLYVLLKNLTKNN